MLCALIGCVSAQASSALLLPSTSEQHLRNDMHPGVFKWLVHSYKSREPETQFPPVKAIAHTCIHLSMPDPTLSLGLAPDGALTL